MFDNLYIKMNQQKPLLYVCLVYKDINTKIVTKFKVYELREEVYIIMAL